MVKRIITTILFIMLIFTSVAWAGELKQVGEAPVGKYYFDGAYSRVGDENALKINILFIPTVKEDGNPDHTVFTYYVYLDKGYCVCTMREDYDSNDHLYKEYHYERLISVPIEQVDCIVNALNFIEAGDYPLFTTVVVGGDSRGQKPESTEVRPGSYFRVVLYAAGGTGFGWVLDSKSLKLVEAMSKDIEPVNSQPLLVGGETRWEFYLRVKPGVTGQETLHFSLIRPWEKNVKPAQVFDLTVVASR